jgi:hypothetical protein
LQPFEDAAGSLANAVPQLRSSTAASVRERIDRSFHDKPRMRQAAIPRGHRAPDVEDKAAGHWRDLPPIRMVGRVGVCFGSRANLLDESSAAQRLDRSLKGSLQLPLPNFLVCLGSKGNGNDTPTYETVMQRSITKLCAERFAAGTNQPMVAYR